MKKFLKIIVYILLGFACEIYGDGDMSNDASKSNSTQPTSEFYVTPPDEENLEKTENNGAKTTLSSKTPPPIPPRDPKLGYPAPEIAQSIAFPEVSASETGTVISKPEITNLPLETGTIIDVRQSTGFYNPLAVHEETAPTTANKTTTKTISVDSKDLVETPSQSDAKNPSLTIGKRTPTVKFAPRTVTQYTTGDLMHNALFRSNKKTSTDKQAGEITKTTTNKDGSSSTRTKNTQGQTIRETMRR